MNSIGNRIMFAPVPENCEGITYRQWLIGQIAIGVNKDFFSEDFAETTIKLADAIIANLDSEVNNV